MTGRVKEGEKHEIGLRCLTEYSLHFVLAQSTAQ
jgi:hypothetical protein